MLIFLSLILTVILHMALFRKRGLLDPVSVFFIAYLYYCYFVPTTMVFFGEYDILILDAPIWVSDAIINKVALLNFICYAGYGLAYYQVTKTLDFGLENVPAKNVVTLLQDTPTLRVLALTAAGCIGVVIFFFGSQLASVTTDYASKIESNYDNSVFAYIFGIFQVISSVGFNFLILRAKQYHVYTTLSMLFFIILSVMTFSKAPFVFALLCGFCFLSRYRKLPPEITLGIMILLGVWALVYLVPSFAVYRGTGELSFISSDQISLNLLYSDASGPFGVIVLAISGYLNADNHPLWQSFLLWVPRFVWASRPIDLPEEFARQMITNWQPGYGLGFSPLAEAYARYGLYGAGLLMAVLGGVIGGFQRFFGSLFEPAARVPVILSIGGYTSLITLRGAFSGVFTTSLQLWAPMIVIALLARALSVGRRSTTSLA